VASALAEVLNLRSRYRVFEFVPDRGAATDANTPPKRQPDAVVEEKTNTSQAALYRSVSNLLFYRLTFLTLVRRLSGDYNPLHVGLMPK